MQTYSQFNINREREQLKKNDKDMKKMLRNFDVRTYNTLQRQKKDFHETVRVNSLLQDYNK